MDPVTISLPRHTIERGWPTVTATITIGERRFDVFFRVSQGPLAAGIETFLASALLPAMREALPLQAPGPVSLRLREHLPLYQDIISSWYKGFKPVAIEATAADAATRPAAGRGVGCFFSSGVDSFHTVLTHQDEITHLVFLHGYERPLSRVNQEEAAAASVRAAAAELNKPLIEVKTNTRTMLDGYADWGSCSHGTALGAVALLLAPQLRKVYIASSFDYRVMYPWGTSPTIDPLWSSEEMEIIHDGGLYEREQKLEGMAANATALRWLRVCLKNPGSAANCGRCEKCVRTMIGLHLAGALERCATLPHTLDYDLIARQNITYGDHWGMRMLLGQAEERGNQPRLVEALRQCLGVYQEDYRQIATELRDQNRELKRKLRRIYPSRSWRLTEPMRQAGSTLRRLQRRLD